MRFIRLLIFKALLIVVTSGACMEGEDGRGGFSQTMHTPAIPLPPGQPDGLALHGVVPQVGPSAGGTRLVLEGQGFSQGMTVTIAGRLAQEVTVQSGTRATAQLPTRPGAWGKVPIVVQNPGGQQTSRADLFGYYASQVAFPGAYFELGADSTNVVVGDWNGDGKSDAVGLNLHTQSASIALGDGRGGFGPSTVFRTTLGTSPIGIARDFNRDQKLDLAILTPELLEIYPGDGAGGFGSPNSYPQDYHSWTMDAGDFNGDGWLDLVFGGPFSTNIGLLMSKGSGSFEAERKITVGMGPMGVVARDFNGDQKLDLAVAESWDGIVSVRLGDGAGNFGPPTNFSAGGSPLAVAVGDLNGDSKSDLILTNYSANYLSILLGDGIGGFAPVMQVPTPDMAIGVEVGDFNKDMKQDVATISQDLVTLYQGDGRGGFASPIETYVGANAERLAVGDFDGNQYQDLIFGSQMLLLNDGKGSFPGNPRIPILVQWLEATTVADFNGDGRPDLAIGYADSVTYSKAYVTINLNDTNNGFFQSVKLDLTLAADLTAMTSGDFNNDNKIDLIVLARNMYFFPGDGAGGLGTPIESNPGFSVFSQGVQAADFNADGKLDIAFSLISTTSVNIALGDGTGRFGNVKSATVSSTPTDLALGDVNGDGKLDIAVTNNRGHSASVVLGDGAGGLGTSTPYLTGVDPIAIELADLNGDKALDLAVLSRSAKNVTLRFGDGKGAFGQPSYLTTHLNGDDFAVGDWNGDLHADLAVSGPVGMHIYLGDGSGRFVPYRAFVSVGGRMQRADFNLDGRPDLACMEGEYGWLMFLPNLSQ